MVHLTYSCFKHLDDHPCSQQDFWVSASIGLLLDRALAVTIQAYFWGKSCSRVGSLFRTFIKLLKTHFSFRNQAGTVYTHIIIDHY